LRLRQALSKLGRLRLLGVAACLEAGAQLGDVPDLAVGPPDKAPDQGGDHADGNEDTYKEKGEQEFE